jgi:polar amino acid transport system substrate-binding protein
LAVRTAPPHQFSGDRPFAHDPAPTPTRNKETSIMKRFLCLSAFVALALTCNAAFAADECAKITATGHPEYPVISFKKGDQLEGAAPELVEAIAKELKVPLESKYMGSWTEAQAAARDGKADMIFGIYYNDDRATYLDYVQPAYMYDDVAIFVAKGKEFPFKGQDDLVGKKGVTSQGESYGTEFDAFIKDKLDVARSDGIDAAFKDLLAGKADYLIAGYHPGLAEAAKAGLKDQFVALDQALLTAEMFVAFSKKSPCRSLVDGLGKGITEMTTDGRFDAMLTEAMKAWDNAQQAKN